MADMDGRRCCIQQRTYTRVGQAKLPVLWFSPGRTRHKERPFKGRRRRQRPSIMRDQIQLQRLYICTIYIFIYAHIHIPYIQTCVFWHISLASRHLVFGAAAWTRTHYITQAHIPTHTHTHTHMHTHPPTHTHKQGRSDLDDYYIIGIVACACAHACVV